MLLDAISQLHIVLLALVLPLPAGGELLSECRLSLRQDAQLPGGRFYDVARLRAEDGCEVVRPTAIDWYVCLEGDFAHWRIVGLQTLGIVL